MRTLIVVLLLLVLIAVAGYVVTASRRRGQLRARFGPEYDRTVAEAGSTRAGEADLMARQKHRASYDVQPLPDEARQRYRSDWLYIQTAFIDEPAAAVRDADRLVTKVLAERGYPTEDRQRLVGDLSVDLAPEHADVLDRYRQAHEISLRNESREATTEDLRRGMQHYRSLMEELVSS